MQLVSWALRIVAAVILLQTLFFKFTGAEESVYIFSTVGAEPWGRYASGAIELVAAVLMLAPGTVIYGALLSVGIAVGAILSHLTVLGIEVKGDGGLLFALASIVLICGVGLLAIHRRAIPFIGAMLEV